MTRNVAIYKWKGVLILKIEIWNGNNIRFVNKDGQWWAVAKDVADALGFSNAADAVRKTPQKYKGMYKVHTPSGEQDMIFVTEKGLYRLIMRSHKKTAEDFQDWVFDILKQLREATGLEGFEVFRMLDKEHQLKAMDRLNSTMKQPVQVNFIKANTIANKAVSIRYGYPKMVKKADMTPQMLAEREPILDEVVSLMTLNDRYELGLSVSERVYTQMIQTA